LWKKTWNFTDPLNGWVVNLFSNFKELVIGNFMKRTAELVSNNHFFTSVRNS